jgi:hypothetical protein
VDVLTDGMPDTPEEIQGLLDQTKSISATLLTRSTRRRMRRLPILM